MLRNAFALTVLLALAVATPPASATDYRDPKARFTVTIPDGWKSERAKELEQVALVTSAPDVTEKSLTGMCLVLVFDTPDSKSYSQADINAAIDQQLTPEFWKLALKTSGSNDVVLDSSGAREKNGRKIHFVIVSSKDTVEGVVYSLKGKTELHAIPGSFQLVSCLAQVEHYETASVSFESIFNSFEPKAGEYIARAPQASPSVITLYTGPGYNGTARVVAKDTPDMAASGWGTTAASLVVDGAQSWEVCEGAGFSGKCSTIAAAHTSGGTMPIGSMRRLQSPGNVAGTLSTAIRRAFRETLIRAKRH